MTTNAASEVLSVISYQAGYISARLFTEWLGLPVRTLLYQGRHLQCWNKGWELCVVHSKSHHPPYL